MCVLGVGGARGERGAPVSFPEDDKTQPESNRTGRCQLHVKEGGVGAASDESDGINVVHQGHTHSLLSILSGPKNRNIQ